MIRLPKRPTTRWTTIDVAPSQSIDIEITPPAYAALIADRSALVHTERVMIRLECVTDWRGVDDGESAVPFSADRLGDLLREFPDALDAILAAVRPLFSPSVGDPEKNAPAPQDAATPTNAPSTASGCSDSSPNSVA